MRLLLLLTIAWKVSGAIQIKLDQIICYMCKDCSTTCEPTFEGQSGMDGYLVWYTWAELPRKMLLIYDCDMIC